MFVGVTYVLILQNLWDPQGLQLIADMLLHYAAPILTILFWFVGVPKSALKWSDPVRWAGIPVLYLVYALARAAFDGFYPYPFIDVSQLGWPLVLVNGGGLFVAFLIVGLIFVAIGHAMSRKRATTS
ncbi:MAG: Pr6Pr family membrane protein [Hyphomonadaceae bacterium]|nr:Pr6Pr family membrane protein [Hyphomonadaceae bacterium]